MFNFKNLSELNQNILPPVAIKSLSKFISQLLPKITFFNFVSILTTYEGNKSEKKKKLK